jgi:opacity protein-like surface antigen
MRGTVRALGIPALIAVVMAGPAHAQFLDNPQVYVGADVIRQSTRITDNTGGAPDVSGTATSTTARLRAGVKLMEWMAAEFHVIAPRESVYSNTGTENRVSAAAWGIYAKPNYTLGPVNVYALVGAAGGKVGFYGGVTGQRTSGGFSYGAGLQFLVSRHWAVSADAMHYYKESLPTVAGGSIGVRNRAVGVGLTYTFNP